MEHFVEDNMKMRLTEKVDIARAIEILKQQGYKESELIEAATSIFYIDLDVFNEVLKAA